MKKTTAGGLVAPIENGMQGIRSPLEKRTNKRFPHRIMLAVTAISTGGVFGNLLKNSEREVFAFLVRLACTKNPTRPSWAFKRTIAEQLGISEPTVYRALNELEDKMLITRITKTSYVSLTEFACKRLGLIKCDQDDAAAPAPSPALAPETKSVTFYEVKTNKVQQGSATHTKPSDASNKMIVDSNGVNFPSGIQEQSLQKHSTGARTITILNLTKPQKRIRVPVELYWLIETGRLRPSQMFFLMRKFSQIKQRLSDVVEWVKASLLEKAPGDAFRYLRSLLHSETDFSWLVRHANNAAHKAAQKALDKQAVHDWVTKSDGAWFTTKKRQRIVRVDGRFRFAHATWVQDGIVVSGSVSADMLTLADVNRLIPVTEGEAKAILHERMGALPSPVERPKGSVPAQGSGIDVMAELAKAKALVGLRRAAA